MKHVLTQTLAFVLFLTAVAAPAHAQTRFDQIQNQNIQQQLNQPGELSNPQATQTTNAGDATDDGPDADVPAGLNAVLGPVLVPFTGLAYIFHFFANFLLFLAGTFFNWVFSATVLEFSTNFGNSQGVLNAWGIMRDIGNIFLLFGFVFIGISTILGLQNYAARKALPRFLIFAVLLNFSLFAAEAVIDISNATAAAIYSQVRQPVTACQPGWSEDFCEQLDNLGIGISGVVFSQSGLAALEAPDFIEYQQSSNFLEAAWNTVAGAARSVFDANHQLHLIQVLLGLTLFSTVATIVFAAAAIMFVIRGIILTLVMVTAPIGFAGMVVPFLGKLAKDWWHNLINQSFFAPAFVLVVFVGMTIVQSSGLGGNTLVQALDSGNVGMMKAVALFAIVIGFMLAALMVGKKFGAYGADFATGMASKATFSGLGFLAGGTARIARYGLERVTPPGYTLAGRILGAPGRFAVNRALRPAETGALGLQQIPGVKEILGVGGIKPETFKGFESYRDIAKQPGIFQRMREQTQRYQEEVATAGMLDRLGTQRFSNADRSLLTQMSTAELAALGNARLEKAIPHITEAQYEGLMSSDKLSETQKEKYREMRTQRVINAIKAASKSDIRRFSASELAEALRTEAGSRLVQGDKGVEFARLVSDAQADALKTSQKFSAEQRQAWEDLRDQRFDPRYVAQTVRELSENEFASLHPKWQGNSNVLNVASNVQIAAMDPRNLDAGGLAALSSRINRPNDPTQTKQHIDSLRTLNPAFNQLWAGRY